MKKEINSSTRGKCFTKEEVIKAINKSGGIISTVAKKLKCDWHTADTYIKKHELQNYIDIEKEDLLDYAESKLLQNIDANDNTAIIFFLKTQGRKRGYNERVENVEIVQHEELDYSKFTDAELKQLNKLLEKGGK